MKTGKHILSLIFLLLLVSTGRAQQIAVKTNLPMLATMSPNVAFELVTGERSSIDLTVFGSQKPWGKEISLLGIQPEYRYWFNGRPMTREYIGIAALAVTYDITWSDNIYKGDAAGLGVTMGYAMPLGKRLNLEFYGGFGAVYFRQKQYYVSDNFEDFRDNHRPNATGYKLLPVKLGISLSYILK